MKIKANVPILYNGIQYKPGDAIKEFDLDMFKIWLDNKSVKRVDGAEAEITETEAETATPDKQLSTEAVTETKVEALERAKRGSVKNA